MEKEEILDMLYDFADCLGGTNFKEIKGKFDNITIKAKIENGDDIYLEYCDYDGADSYIGVTFGNKSGLQDCAFNPRLDVSNEVSRLLGNYLLIVNMDLHNQIWKQSEILILMLCEKRLMFGFNL